MASHTNLDTTYGSAFIGLIAAAVLYGVTLLQTYLYYRRYPRDSVVVKIMVFILWLLDTTHLVLCIIAIYWYLVTNFSNEDALDRTMWSMELQTDCNGLIGLIVECFFARRVWIMSRNRVLTAIIVLLACVHFGLGIVFTVEGFILMETTKFARLIWVTSTGLGSAAAADIIIAGSLCYYLGKGRTGLTRTDSLISTLIAYSLTTGLVTSVIAFMAVVTFATMPTNFIWLAFFWVLGKCYVNSLLAALNSREFLREKAAIQEGTFIHFSPCQSVGSNRNVRDMEILEISEADKVRAAVAAPLSVNIIHTQSLSTTDFMENPVSSPSANAILLV
ncbi:hypothetical protein BDN72DRAFT_834455 [Pluteus cervinus]|uniref:Uncharacterized protein n=1 Tax=Pluteus cervinus TaxID=181527 RepID=A0ACD3B646_9AGAR|nr:hypothetical protein BDN72DRAFT_834455 [Pluteus cervinus]